MHLSARPRRARRLQGRVSRPWMSMESGGTMMADSIFALMGTWITFSKDGVLYSLPVQVRDDGTLCVDLEDAKRRLRGTPPQNQPEARSTQAAAFDAPDAENVGASAPARPSDPAGGETARFTTEEP